MQDGLHLAGVYSGCCLNKGQLPLVQLPGLTFFMYLITPSRPSPRELFPEGKEKEAGSKCKMDSTLEVESILTFRNGADYFFRFTAHAMNDVAIGRRKSPCGVVFLYELDKMHEPEKSNHPLPPPYPRRGKPL